MGMCWYRQFLLWPNGWHTHCSGAYIYVSLSVHFDMHAPKYQLHTEHANAIQYLSLTIRVCFSLLLASKTLIIMYRNVLVTKNLIENSFRTYHFSIIYLFVYSQKKTVTVYSYCIMKLYCFFFANAAVAVVYCCLLWKQSVKKINRKQNTHTHTYVWEIERKKKQCK